MSYPQTESDLLNEVLLLVDEAATSVFGDLRSGTGAASTLLTTDSVLLFLNEAAEDFCRFCYPLRDRATYTALPIGTRFVQFASSSMVNATYYKLWAARAVSWNGISLIYANASETEGWFSTWNTDANATPVIWFEQGIDGIGIYPPPSTTHDLIVDGLALPTRMTSGSGTTPFNPDQNKALCWHAAAMLCYKNYEDPSLLGRADTWIGMWQSYITQQLDRAFANDAQFMGAHYQRPVQFPGSPSPSLPKNTSEGD